MTVPFTAFGQEDDDEGAFDHPFDSYDPMDIDPTDIEDGEEFLDVLAELHPEELMTEERGGSNLQAAISS